MRKARISRLKFLFPTVVWSLLTSLAVFQGTALADPKTWDFFGVELGQPTADAVAVYTKKYGAPIKTDVNLEAVIEGCVAVASNQNRRKCSKEATKVYGNIPHHYYFDKNQNDPNRRISVHLDTTAPGDDRIIGIRFKQNYPPGTPEENITAALVKKYGPFDRKVMGGMLWESGAVGSPFISARVTKKPDHMLLGMTVSHSNALKAAWKEQEKLGAALGRKILGQ